MAIDLNSSHPEVVTGLNNNNLEEATDSNKQIVSARALRPNAIIKANHPSVIIKEPHLSVIIKANHLNVITKVLHLSVTSKDGATMMTNVEVALSREDLTAETTTKRDASSIDFTIFV